jgi:hypothetical protein
VLDEDPDARPISDKEAPDRVTPAKEDSAATDEGDAKLARLGIVSEESLVAEGDRCASPAADSDAALEDGHNEAMPKPKRGNIETSEPSGPPSAGRLFVFQTKVSGTASF